MSQWPQGWRLFWFIYRENEDINNAIWWNIWLHHQHKRTKVKHNFGCKRTCRRYTEVSQVLDLRSESRIFTCTWHLEDVSSLTFGFWGLRFTGVELESKTDINTCFWRVLNKSMAIYKHGQEDKLCVIFPNDRQRQRLSNAFALFLVRYMLCFWALVHS